MTRWSLIGTALAVLSGCAILASCGDQPISVAPEASTAPSSTPITPAQQTLESGCVACHADAKALKAVAAPTPVPVASAEQQGEG